MSLLCTDLYLILQQDRRRRRIKHRFHASSRPIVSLVENSLFPSCRHEPSGWISTSNLRWWIPMGKDQLFRFPWNLHSRTFQTFNEPIRIIPLKYYFSRFNMVIAYSKTRFLFNMSFVSHWYSIITVSLSETLIYIQYMYSFPRFNMKRYI